MANASDYLEQQIYNHIFRNDTFAKPTNISIGLTNDVPQDDGTYSEVSVASSAYARIAGASGDSYWTAHSASGPGDNVANIEFPTATANWGVVSGVIICDDIAASGGNLLLHGELTSPKNVESGDTFRFSAGDLDIQIA